MKYIELRDGCFFVFEVVNGYKRNLEGGDVKNLWRTRLRPIRAGGAIPIDCKNGRVYAFETEPCDYQYGVEYHKDGEYYVFTPPLEIKSDADEVHLRELFASLGKKFEVVIANGKKYGKVDN